MLITNDPYKTAGQLLDVTVLVPAWRDERIVGFFGSTIHHTDVGGYGIGAGARDVFEEGLWIPITQADASRASATTTSGSSSCPTSASPSTVTGDLHAQMASGEIGATRLNALLDAHGLDDIEESRRRDHRALRGRDAPGDPRAARRDVPGAARCSTSPTAREIDIHVAVTVDPDSGRDPGRLRRLVAGAARPASTSCSNYTHAYTTFTIRSVLNPEVPNNHGSLAPIKVEAPEGSIVHAVSPAPCTARHVVGMFLPMPLLQALAQVLPDQVMAEGAGAVWTCQVSGVARRRPARSSRRCSTTPAASVPAPRKPGLSATAYPTGVAAVPVEVVESTAPLVFRRKELRPASGGDGEQPVGSAR